MNLVIGVLAHVDSGKTTLAEAMLYAGGSIRKVGRVDHGDAFLDTDEKERSRGITIFSKQARLVWKNMNITLLDTPGHVDFSAEMERTLQVLDYAVLLISAADGIQGHVLTLWQLLERYRIPVFLFINKMDQEKADKERLLSELKKQLDERLVDFSTEQETEQFLENIALCEETVLERYLEEGTLEAEQIRELIAERKVFPCYFGSALKLWGIEEFLDGVGTYGREPVYPETFGARVYKIARDSQGNRLTYLKVTGGNLQVKQSVVIDKDGMEEKIDQIRLYSGEKFATVKEAAAGTVCAVTGFTGTFCGQGLGHEESQIQPMLTPVMTYRIMLPEDCDIHVMYKKLCQLEEEEPQLHIVWQEQTGEIHAQLMGEVQIEILQQMIEERFGVKAAFDKGSILYQETIGNIVEGVGHFEPLRHYAEVHLILEPLEAGSGLVFDTVCSEDVLDRNWQRLILTHLEERIHPGVLTGAPITDMKIILAAGKSHPKHTEGGDFRQATYRAVRHGLSKAKSILLEPVYAFKLELPSGMIGRAMTDIQAMHGHCDPPVTDGEFAVLTGSAPAATMQGYQTQVLAYSGGKGRFFSRLKGYEPCHNTEEVIAASGYEAERDIANPASSVFCAHGAGYVVEWPMVEEYMHLESVLPSVKGTGHEPGSIAAAPGISESYAQNSRNVSNNSSISGNRGTSNDKDADRNKGTGSSVNDKELEEIFKRTYGTTERKKPGYQRTIHAGSDQGTSGYKRNKKPEKKQQEYLLVDGYNIIFAWEDLKELSEVNLDGARGRLMDILSNYQGYRKMTLILVFDAYKVKGNPGSVFSYHNIHVVYTKEAETADQYIEKVTHELAGEHQVTVATSDGLEQLIIMGQGARRMSARELRDEIMSTSQELRRLIEERREPGRQYLFDALSAEMAEKMEAVRLGEDSF